MKTRTRHAAFTLVEMLVAVCLSAGVGLIVYGVATEAVTAFARNISINRSYSNARQSLDRIGIALQSSGNTPVLVDATGADIAPAPAIGVAAAGIRFWRYASTPVYDIFATPALTDTQLQLDLSKPTLNNLKPIVGDMITSAALCFQARITGVTISGTTATVTFSGTFVSNTYPTLTSTALAAAAAAAAATSNGKMTCLDWTPVAFIAINNQLRYYPQFISGTTAVNTAANYQVLTYLTSSQGGGTTPLPFSLGPSPSINVDLYAEAPDYNNRTNVAGTLNGYNGLNTANTFSYLQTALSPRNPIGMIRNP